MAVTVYDYFTTRSNQYSRENPADYWRYEYSVLRTNGSVFVLSPSEGQTYVQYGQSKEICSNTYFGSIFLKPSFFFIRFIPSIHHHQSSSPPWQPQQRKANPNAVEDVKESKMTLPKMPQVQSGVTRAIRKQLHPLVATSHS
jgi:hypothetical protein